MTDAAPQDSGELRPSDCKSGTARASASEAYSPLWTILCRVCMKPCTVHKMARRVCAECSLQPKEIMFAAKLAQRRAHRRVRRAILRGELPRLDGSIPCSDCKNPAEVYEHRCYLSPLDVQPVCRTCNILRGPAIDSAVLKSPPSTSVRPGNPSAECRGNAAGGGL